MSMTRRSGGHVRWAPGSGWLANFFGSHALFVGEAPIALVGAAILLFILGRVNRPRV